ncbi:MAG: hypothetical protein KDC54_17295, partial [Lewinella sp.]|nr:hypothetical protein [Lewinella sp.]
MRKDIFDLFRERAAQIEETPSPQAWNRLERRLNSRRPSVRREARRVSLHRSLGMVASLALVLGLIAGLVWLAERRPAAAFAQQGTPTVIEDLALHTSDAADFPVPEIVQRDPDIQASNPITEGRPQQKLIVKGE